VPNEAGNLADPVPVDVDGPRGITQFCVTVSLSGVICQTTFSYAERITKSTKLGGRMDQHQPTIIVAVVVAKSGLAFLESHGDVWDAQKDMLLAGCGGLLTILGVAAFNFYYDRNFVRDLEQGFRLDKN
jgi:hypothetical protein